MACLRERQRSSALQGCSTAQPSEHHPAGERGEPATPTLLLETLPYPCWRIISTMLDAASVVAASSTCHKLLVRGRSKAVWSDKLHRLPPRVRDALGPDSTEVDHATGGAGGPAPADSVRDQGWAGRFRWGWKTAAAGSTPIVLPAEPNELAQYRRWCTRRRFPRTMRSSPTTSNPEAIFKVVLLGPTVCGKTSLCRSISNGCRAAGPGYPDAHSIDFIITSRTARSGLDCKFQVWDGSHSCPWMRHAVPLMRAFLRGAQLLVFCYDESDNASLKDAQSLAEYIKKYYADLRETGAHHPASAEPAYMVLGTKSDLPKAVSNDDVDKLANTLRSPVTCGAAIMLTCSATTGDGVSEFVQSVADECEANSFDDGSAVDSDLHCRTKPLDEDERPPWTPLCVIS